MRLRILCSIGCVILGACAEEVASVSCVAVESQLKTAQQQAAECLQLKETEASKYTTALAAANSQRTTEVASKQQELEKAQADLAQYKKVLGEWQARASQLEKQVASLSTEGEQRVLVERQLQEAQKQLQTAEMTFKQREAEANSQISQLTSDMTSSRAQCQSEQSKLSGELKTQTEQTKAMRSQVAQMQQEISKLRVEVTTFQSEINKQSELIFSSAQFWKTYEDSRRIFVAFGSLLHQRLVGVMGQNTYDLMKLQVSMLSSRAKSQSAQLYAAGRKQAASLYDRHLRTRMDPIIEKQVMPLVATAKERGQETLVKAQEAGRKGLLLVDKRMDTLVRRLSSVDPSIREMFPADFHERCYAFAFVSLLVFGATHLIGWVWSTFVTTPLSFVFGRSHEKKKAPRRVLKRGAVKKIHDEAEIKDTSSVGTGKSTAASAKTAKARK